MPHLTNMVWSYKDELVSVENGSFTSFYNYDFEGNRTRKVKIQAPNCWRKSRNT